MDEFFHHPFSVEFLRALLDDLLKHILVEIFHRCIGGNHFVEDILVLLLCKQGFLVYVVLLELLEDLAVVFLLCAHNFYCNAVAYILFISLLMEKNIRKE